MFRSSLPRFSFVATFALAITCILALLFGPGTARPVYATGIPGGVTGPRLWFKADEGVTTTGTTVTAWADQSGNGSNATGVGTPVYKTNALNGYPTIEFSGAPDRLATPALQLFATNNAPLTTFVVFDTDNAEGQKFLINHGVPPVCSNSFEIGYDTGTGTGSGNFGIHKGCSNATIAPANTITNNTFNLMTNVVFATGTTPNNQAIYQNGTALTLANTLTGWVSAGSYSTSSRPIDIGARNDYGSGTYNAHHVGDIAEVLIYQRNLTTAERERVHSYLALKYGMTLTHDYQSSAGTLLWDVGASGGYDNDIAGIGVDTVSSLSQAQSASINTDNLFTLTAQAGNLANGEFLLWGNDNGALIGSIQVPANITERLTRRWRSAETGDTGPANMLFNLSGITDTDITSAGNLALLVDADGDFSNATVVATAPRSGTSVTFSNIDLSNGQYFTLAVPSSGTYPTISDIANQTINEDTTLNALGFTVNDSDTPLANLIFSVTSSNATLMPEANISFGGSGNNRTITAAPTVNQSGVATITVTVSDGTTTASDSFVLTVNSVNDAPTLDALANQTISAATVVNLAGIGDGDADLAQNLTVTATSNNTAVVPNPVVTYTSPNANGSINLNPVAAGTATITVRVTDNGSNTAPNVNFFERTFVVNVTQSLTVGGSRDYSENAGAVVISPTLTVASPFNITAARVVLGTGFVAAEDRLGIQGQAGTGGTINGITWAYNTANGVMTLTGNRSAADYQATLRLVTYTNLSETPTTASRVVAFAIGDMLPNDANGRFYRYVNGTITWVNARTGAASAVNQRFGMTGYLATITTAQENAFLLRTLPNTSWLGASDATGTPVNGTNKIWRWVTGPEGLEESGQGRFFFRQRNDHNTTAGCGNGPALSQPPGQYTNWAANEPNDYNANTALRGCAGQEDYLLFNNTGTWNDSGAGTQGGYLIEYGGLPGDSPLQISGNVTINITAANDVPVNTVPTAQTINEDTNRVFNTANANLISIADVDAGTNPVRVTLTATNGTVTLAGVAGLTFGPGDGTADATMTFTGTIAAINTALNGLNFTLTPNAGGTATLEIITNDLGNTPAPATSDTDTVTINITPINDVPALDAIANLDLGEDAPAQTVNLSGISDGDAESTQSLAITATSSNPALIPNPTVTYTSDNSTGSLSFAPTANAVGTATITVRVTDNGSNTPPNVNFFERTFVVTVNALNDGPTLNTINDLNLNEDAAAQTIALGGITDGDADLAQTLTISATSSNPALIPNPAVTYTSPNLTGSLAFTPAANANGTATITIRVTDNGSNAAPNVNFFERTFVVTVAAVNDAPTLNTISDLNLSEDAGEQTINLTGISDGDPELFQSLTVFATSSNPALIPNPIVSHVDANITTPLTFTPVANANGTATITVRVTDPGSNTAPNVNFFERTFVVNVAAVNDAPTLDALSDLTLAEDALEQTVPLAGIADGDPELAQTLTITATSSNLALIANPTVNYTSANPAGNIQFTPVANAYGTATITVRVRDNGSNTAPNVNFFERTFVITVVGVPDGAPEVTNATTLEDTQSTGGLVLTAPDAATTHFQITAINGGTLFLNDGTTTIANGDFITVAQGNAGLRFTPNPNSIAEGSFSAQQSNGNSAPGLAGETTSATITLTPVNDSPALDVLSDLLIDEDAAAQNVNLTGIAPGPANASDESTQTLTVTVTSSNPALIAPTVNYSSGNATGSLSFTPAVNGSGSAIITVKVTDSGGTANGGIDIIERNFTVTVQAINDGPINTVPGTQAATENTNLLISGLSVADLDIESNTLTVVLSVNNGRLTVSTSAPGGLSAAGVSGNSSASLTLSGTLAQINATLAAGLTYRSNIGFEGNDTLTMISNDNGASGNGGALSDSDTVMISVASSADLSVTISDTPDPVVAGAPLAYTITVRNDGPSVALASTLDLVLSAGVSLVNVTSSIGTCSGNLSCSFGDLPVGAEVNITVNVTVAETSRGTLSAGATVSSSTPDPLRADNSANAITTITGDVVLELSKTASPSTVSAGEPLTYTLTVRNNGTSASLGVVLTDTLPIAFTQSSISASQGDCAGIGTIGCSLGTLGSGESATVTIVGTLDQAARGELLNSASVSDNEGLTTFTALVSPITARAELQISKTASAFSATPGGSLSYTITVTNTGPALATGVVLTDTLPAGTSLSDLDDGGLPCAATTCSIGELPVGASATIRLVVAIDPAARGTLNNSASASAVEAPTVSSSVNTTLAPVADLSIVSLSESGDPVGIGNTVRYEAVVRNDGPSAALSPQLIFSLPSNLSFVGSLPAGLCVGAGSALNCTLANLAPGATATFSIEARATATGVALTAAEVRASETDPVASNNRAEISTSILNTVIYLPMVLFEARPNTPDLVVSAINISNGQLEVVITNQGTAPIFGAFWVDLYINPTTLQLVPNQTWPNVAQHGMAWGVAGNGLPLQPGASLTLRPGDSFYVPEISSPIALVPGMLIAVQADSAADGSAYGAIPEGHELSGEAYNNITSIVVTEQLPVQRTTGNVRSSANAQSLPRR
jgi:uncharacterized repeat protein (TIGR01451 family)